MQAMSARNLWAPLVLCVALSTSVAGADSGLQIAPPSAAAEVEPPTLKALGKAVAADVAGDAASEHLEGYTLFPKLVSLRKFIEGETKTPTISCVVELSVVDPKGAVVAKVWGSSNATNATAAHTVEAAAHAAMGRLAVSLRALSERERRVARERDRTARNK
jgi:hypothetical protein